MNNRKKMYFLVFTIPVSNCVGIFQKFRYRIYHDVQNNILFIHWSNLIVYSLLIQY